MDLKCKLDNVPNGTLETIATDCIKISDDSPGEDTGIISELVASYHVTEIINLTRLIQRSWYGTRRILKVRQPFVIILETST